MDLAYEMGRVYIALTHQYVVEMEQNKREERPDWLDPLLYVPRESFKFTPVTVVFGKNANRRLR